MFINPLMLAGLAGAVIPLVLHLLSKARYRTVDWGAMMFLQGADARQHQSTRLKQWLLLLLRMAIVASLAMALARPIVRSSWGGLAGSGRTTTAIVLDCSMSMSIEEAGRSRFDQAREVVLQILAGLKRGDQAMLILAGSIKSESQIQPTSDLQGLASRLAELKPGLGEADLAESLITAADALERFEPFNRQLFVVTDRQAISWRNVDDNFRAGWQGRMKQQGIQVRLAVMPVGSNQSDNLAITGMILPSPPAIRNQLAEVEVKLHNYGTVARPGIPLTVSSNGKQIHAESVSIAPDSDLVVRVPVKFSESGPQVLSAQVQSTGLVADDTLDCVVDVVEPLRVLILSGDERSEPFRSESVYVRLALAPYQSAKQDKPDPAIVDVQPIEHWSQVDLDRYQVLVLANIEQLSVEQIRVIEQFTYGGGGLLVAPGSLSRADVYTQTLYRNGAGVLPAALSPAADDPVGATLLGIDLQSPVFYFLKGKANPIPAASIGRYFPATPAGNARILASYVSGKPFLIETTFGRGKVLLLTTALDADWSTLPLSNFYLPFVQSSLRYLAGGSVPRRNLLPGKPIEMSIEQPIDEKSLVVIQPSGRRSEPDVTHVGARTDTRFVETNEIGRYQLRYKSKGKDSTQWFVVNPPREESDLTGLTEAQWQPLIEGLPMERIDPNERSISVLLQNQRNGRELWAALIGLVLLLSVSELVLTRLWSQEAA